MNKVKYSDLLKFTYSIDFNLENLIEVFEINCYLQMLQLAPIQPPKLNNQKV